MFLPVAELDWDFLGAQAFFMIIEIEELSIFIVPWIANFTYLGNLLLRDKNVSIRITISAFTVVFSLFSFWFFTSPFQEKGMFSSYMGPGLIVWILSFVLMLISQIKESKKNYNSKMIPIKKAPKQML